jgi:hypothetical protein
VGELILLFIDVEQNTRGAEFYSEQTKKAVVALVQAVTQPRNQPPFIRPSSVPILATSPCRRSSLIEHLSLFGGNDEDRPPRRCN